MAQPTPCICGPNGASGHHSLGCPARKVEIADHAWPQDQGRIDVIAQNGNEGLHYDEATTAPTILLRARDHLHNRAATRDTPQGERSMARAVAIFTAATGLQLTARDGWLFMVALKIARSQAGGYNADDYEDLAAYAALYGEETANG